MQNLENVPGLMSLLEEKVVLCDIAKNNMLIAAAKVDSAIRAEWEMKLDDLKNKDYLIVNVAYFGIDNCLKPLNSGDNFKYMRFLEEKNDSFVLSTEFKQIFEFDFDKSKDLFGGKKKFNNLIEKNEVFADFMKEDTKYLVFLKYLHNGSVMDFDSLHEFVLVRLEI